MSTLVYFGSCTDTWPIQRYAYLHRTFVYVDGLPDSHYFAPGCAGHRLTTMDGFLADFTKNLVDSGIEISSSVITNQSSTVTIATTQDLVIKLFLNTLDVDAWKNDELRSYLDKAETLFMKGYLPTIAGPLPALKRIIHSAKCDPPDASQSWVIDPSQYQNIVVDEYEQRGFVTEFTVEGECCEGCTGSDCDPPWAVMHC
ncbi:hypothetical protein DFS34DRAFT_592197 [Phlyctochytrium arcticum]|nr:hypothetical protein DFS34DRAFT_592197 [Phlyctochytrium arcticum]